MTEAAQRLERTDQLEELRFQKALLEAQGEASLDGILVVSGDGRILFYNRRFAELWRLTPEVLAQRSDVAALEAVRDQLADPDQFLTQVGLLYANPSATSRDEIQLKDGRVFERYTAPVTGPDGTHYGRVWFFRDATEQREAAEVRDQLVHEHAAREAALQRTTRLRALHEAALAIAGPVSADQAAVAQLLATITARAVAALDARDGRLVLADDAAWADLVPKRPDGERGADGGSGEIVLGHTGQLRRAAQRSSGATEHVLLTGEAVVVPDTRAPSRFGPYPQLAEVGIGSLIMVPLRTAGEVIGVLGVTFNEGRPRDLLETEDRDVLELFAAHAAAALQRVRLAYADRQLAHQRDELAQRDAETIALREVDRLKSELLSTVSHELRTPLSVIYGYAQLVQRRGGQSAGAADRMLAAASQLTRLVEDLLDFANFERGEVSVRPEVFDVVTTARALASEFRARDGGERIREVLPARLPVFADRGRVAQVLANLLENALKYAPSGPIVVRAKHIRSGEGDRHFVRLEVADRGPGIPLVEQPRVWERFYRGQRVNELNLARGTGIGLAVVKALVEAQGGRVGLKSTPGRGARFWADLPAAA